MIFPVNFEQKIGFDKIREILKDLALSPIAVEIIDRLEYSTDFEHIKSQLNLTNEFKLICTDRFL